MRSGTIVEAILLIIFIIPLSSQAIELSDSPIIISGGSKHPTGVGWGDMNGDSWLDLVVSNGLEFAGVGNEVYYNNEGVIEVIAGWVSDDARPSGNLYIGDFDNNGEEDLLVSYFGLIYQGFPPGPNVIYYDNGGLSPTPGWLSQETNSFSCVTGDPDGDGDLGVNIGDVVYIGNHVFRNGECTVNPPIGCPPVPYEAGDVNCDESVNIGDAVYLGNVIFRPGSPLPCAGCP